MTWTIRSIGSILPRFMRRFPFSAVFASFPEDEEVGVVLSGVDLFDRAAHAGTVFPHDDEEVFCDEAHVFVGVHDLDMSESLSVCADFVLAFDDEDAAFAQDAQGFDTGFQVEVEDGVVVLALGLPTGCVICVVPLERMVSLVGATSR